MRPIIFFPVVSVSRRRPPESEASFQPGAPASPFYAISRVFPRALLVRLAIFFFSLCFFIETGLSRANAGDTLSKTVRVTWVFDGDTIQVASPNGGKRFTLRLAAIDAPEKGSRGTAGQPFSERSRACLSDLVHGKIVRIEPLSLDRYDRLLAVVFIGNVNVNLAMVRNGMAEVYRGRVSEGVDKGTLLEAEKKAREEKRGIWRRGRHYESPFEFKARHRLYRDTR